MRIPALSVMIVLAMVSAVLAPSSPATAAPAADKTTSCPRAEVIAMRGSGQTVKETFEGGKYTWLKSSDWEGPPMRSALVAYEKAAHDKGLDPTTTVVNDISPEEGYDSTSMNEAAKIGSAKAFAYLSAGAAVFADFSFTLAEIMTSAKRGTAAGFHAIETSREATPPACDFPRYVGMGFSQGSMALRMMYATYGESGPLDALLVAGDPLQNGETDPVKQKQNGLHGDGAHGSGLYTKSLSAPMSMNLVSDDVKDDLPGIYTSKTPHYMLCHKSDPFCDHSWVAGLLWMGTHHTYFKKAKDTGESSPWLVKQLHDLAPETLRPPKPVEYTAKAVAPFWAGFEGRLDIGGVPEGSTVDFEIVTGDDPWDAGAVKVGSFSAVNGPPSVTGKQSLLDPSPDFVPKGTHGFVVPSDIPTGTYWMRMSTHEGHTAVRVGIADPTVITDWNWWEEYWTPDCGSVCQEERSANGYYDYLYDTP
jgi:hypothetical protein